MAQRLSSSAERDCLLDDLQAPIQLGGHRDLSQSSLDFRRPQVLQKRTGVHIKTAGAKLKRKAARSVLGGRVNVTSTSDGDWNLPRSKLAVCS